MYGMYVHNKAVTYVTFQNKTRFLWKICSTGNVIMWKVKAFPAETRILSVLKDLFF